MIKFLEEVGEAHEDSRRQNSTDILFICSDAVRTEYCIELNVPKEAIQKAREIFEEVPQLHDVFVNPTIAGCRRNERVIDRVFPQEMRNFLKDGMQI